MIKILLKLKNMLISEALYSYLKSVCNQNYQIHLQEKPATDYDIVIFDQSSLRESNPEDFPFSKKVLIDEGLQKEETLFLSAYFGLSGLLSADTTPKQLPKYFEVLVMGERGLPNNLCQRKMPFEGSNALAKREYPRLTPREREIVKLICDGLSNKDVAQRLSLSEQTVKGHLNRVFKKTGLKNRKQLIKFFSNTLLVYREFKGLNGTIDFKEKISSATEPIRTTPVRKVLKIRTRTKM